MAQVWNQVIGAGECAVGFIEGAENVFKASPARERESAQEEPIKQLQAGVGEVVLGRDILRKELSNSKPARRRPEYAG